MSKQQAQRALINIEYKVAKPFVDAAALGLGSSAFAVAPLAPPVISWACIGAGVSFFWYWGSNNLTRSKKKKAKAVGPGGHITVNSASGSRKIHTFDYQAPRYVLRETYPQAIWHKIWRTPEPRRQGQAIDKPKWMKEFVFHSHYEGRTIQMSEGDVTRFLNAAWRHRRRGVGLSERHWVRDIKQRPQWYKNLGGMWYYALINLLWEVEELSGRQLIVPVGWQQYALAKEPHQILEALRWAEALKGNIPQSPQPELVIGTEGVSSY